MRLAAFERLARSSVPVISRIRFNHTKCLLNEASTSAAPTQIPAQIQTFPALCVRHPQELPRFTTQALATLPPEVKDRDKFAIVDINTAQFKVMKGDQIMTDKLKNVEVGQELIFDKVLLLGTREYTLIGRPTVPNVKIHATIEEQTKLGKILVFKKKRRKGYRRMHGHRSEVTILRITDVINENPGPS